jgi:DHA2 family multidrug resistance protein
MRNLGGSVGISVATTLLARRGQIHQDRVVSNLTPTALPFHSHLQMLAARWHSFGYDSVTAGKRALAAIYQTVQTQSAMLAYLDIFMVLMYCCGIAAFLALFLKKIELGKAHAGH